MLLWCLNHSTHTNTCSALLFLLICRQQQRVLNAAAVAYTTVFVRVHHVVLC